MNLLFYLPVFQMLAGEKAMAKEIKVQKIEDVDFIPLNKEKIQKSIYIVILQDIISLSARRNIPKNYQNLRKKNSRKRSISAKIWVIAKKMALYLILP